MPATPASRPTTGVSAQTDKPARGSPALLADDVIRFLDAVGIEQATLVGHDWGGIIAFKAAIDHPDRINRLALLDTLCTVWAPAAVHGWWFKVEGLAEELFGRYHREFIEVLFGGRDAPVLGTRPASPWPIPPGDRPRPDWIGDDDLDSLRAVVLRPDVWRHAISYYRYGLPFHRVLPDLEAAHGERFESLSETQVAEMWLYDGGLEAHPGTPRRWTTARTTATSGTRTRRCGSTAVAGAREPRPTRAHRGAIRERLRRSVLPLLPRPAGPLGRRRPLPGRGGARVRQRERWSCSCATRWPARTSWTPSTRGRPPTRRRLPPWHRSRRSR